MNRNAKIIDENYLNYVRLQPCLVCAKRPVDADHLKARGWEQAKRNDYSAIPLCREHHSERGQIGDVRFCDKYAIGNLWMEVFYLVSGYLAMRRPEAVDL